MINTTKAWRIEQKTSIIHRDSLINYYKPLLFGLMQYPHNLFYGIQSETFLLWQENRLKNNGRVLFIIIDHGLLKFFSWPHKIRIILYSKASTIKLSFLLSLLFIRGSASEIIACYCPRYIHFPPYFLLT